MNQLNDLKKTYQKTEVPENLELVVRQSIRRATMKKRINVMNKVAVVVLAGFVALGGLVNVNRNIAMAMSDLPVIGKVVEVLSFRFDAIDEDGVHAEIEAPVVEGLENQDLQASLNKQYYEEAETLYKEFMAEMGPIIEAGGHMGVDSGYVIKTDTEALLSIGRYTVNTVGSSSTTFKYDTIDKENGVLITLPGLFADETYVETISKYLIETMKAEMEADPDKVYWVEEDGFTHFESIDPNQQFFITENNKLVLSFDKYEIAPGYMGVIEFEIPTEIIKELLVGEEYVN
jgi:hypothetical protein